MAKKHFDQEDKEVVIVGKHMLRIPRNPADAPGPTLTGGAHFSEDGKHRLILWRDWEPSLYRAVWVMLNPSRAGWPKDDATIRRLTGFCRSWGLGGYDVVNLSSLIATNPKNMLATPVTELLHLDAMGAIDAALAAPKTGLVICAWGANVKKSLWLQDRISHIMALCDHYGHTPLCLGTTKDGYPKHPLYLAKNLLPTTYEWKI